MTFRRSVLRGVVTSEDARRKSADQGDEPSESKVRVVSEGTLAVCNGLRVVAVVV